MNKLLFFLFFVSSLFAVPPCELPNQDVCMYFYKGSMSSEIIITNVSMDKVLIENANASLDGNSKNIRGLTLERGQTFTMLKSQYDNPEKKPYYRIGYFNYKILK